MLTKCYHQWQSVTFSEVLYKSRGVLGGGGGVGNILEIEYIHRISSSMMHNHKSQHGTRVQQKKVTMQR
jgi:hypothetical protein